MAGAVRVTVPRPSRPDAASRRFISLLPANTAAAIITSTAARARHFFRSGAGGGVYRACASPSRSTAGLVAPGTWVRLAMENSFEERPVRDGEDAGAVTRRRRRGRP